jgi:uncharacterized protein YrrD
MLVKTKELKGYNLNAIDGEIGSVKEFYFDDRFWTIRYLVANTGTWLTGRQVVISPYFMHSVNYESKLINIDLSKQQMEDSPSLDLDKGMSRQYEEDYNTHYGSPTYYGGPNMWGASSNIIHDRNQWKTDIRKEGAWESNLRSSKDVSGHNIQATDGEIGHVDDFIFDDDSWAIRYLILDTKNWLPGKKVLVAPQWIDRISWDDSKVFVNLSRETIKQAPGYDEDLVISRDYETHLHEHYNRQGYWLNDPVLREYSH